MTDFEGIEIGITPRDLPSELQNEPAYLGRREFLVLLAGLTAVPAAAWLDAILSTPPPKLMKDPGNLRLVTMNPSLESHIIERGPEVTQEFLRLFCLDTNTPLINVAEGVFRQRPWQISSADLQPSTVLLRQGHWSAASFVYDAMSLRKGKTCSLEIRLAKIDKSGPDKSIYTQIPDGGFAVDPGNFVRLLEVVASYLFDKYGSTFFKFFNMVSESR